MNVAEKTEIRKNATKDPFDLLARRLHWSAPPQVRVWCNSAKTTTVKVWYKLAACEREGERREKK